MNKKIQLSILSIFIAAALIGSVVTIGDNMAFAGGKDKHDDDDNKKEYKSYHKGKHSGNEAEQSIEQGQWSSQNAQCVSGDVTFISCNNLAFQFQNNEGNLAMGQE
jgi:hypothetical protein